MEITTQIEYPKTIEALYTHEVKMYNSVTGAVVYFKEEDLSYDKLVLGMGSKPRQLPIPGLHLEGVYTVTDLHKAIAARTNKPVRYFIVQSAP